jgi:hypothetical protein
MTARRLAWKQSFYNESVAAHELRRKFLQMAGNILITFIFGKATDFKESAFSPSGTKRSLLTKA